MSMITDAPARTFRGHGEPCPRDKQSLDFSARYETHKVMGRADEVGEMVVCMLTTVRTATCIESMCCGSGIQLDAALCWPSACKGGPRAGRIATARRDNYNNSTDAGQQRWQQTRAAPPPPCRETLVVV